MNLIFFISTPTKPCRRGEDDDDGADGNDDGYDNVNVDGDFFIRFGILLQHSQS